jgi:hypothetical protein
MNLQNVVAGLILIVLLGSGLAGLLALCGAIFPAPIERAQRIAEQMPRRAFAVGLLNALFFGLIAAACGSQGDLGGLLALLILTGLLGYIAVGLTAVAALVGARLAPPAWGPLRRLLAGALALELAALVPLVGWVAVPALAGLTGYGALIIALLRRGRAAPALPVE